MRPAPVRGGTLPRGSVREAGVHDADLGVHDAPIRPFTLPILAFTMIRSCCSRCADPGVHDRPKHATSVHKPPFVGPIWLATDQTRALIVKDAAANLSDDQYHAKRDPMFLPWTEVAETVDRLRDAGTEKAE